MDITCISDLYYKMGRWFTFMMCAIAFLTLPLALDILDSPVTFIMCAGLVFVGAAAEYRDKTVYPIHAISASVSGICSVIWTYYACPPSLACLGLSLIAFVDEERWLLYVELSCILCVASAVILSI